MRYLYTQTLIDTSKNKEGILDKLRSIESAAEFLGGISAWTVRAWLSQGKLSRVKIGSRTMVRESELQRVIRDGGKSRAPGRGGRKRNSGESVSEHRK